MIRTVICAITSLQGTLPVEPSNGALNPAQQVPDAEPRAFSDNAPSWEELSLLVEQRSQELQWSMPDMDSVCFCT